MVEATETPEKKKVTETGEKKTETPVSGTSDVATRNAISDTQSSQLASDLARKGAEDTLNARKNNAISNMLDGGISLHEPVIFDGGKEKVSQDKNGNKVLEVKNGDTTTTTTYDANHKMTSQDVVGPNGKLHTEVDQNGNRVETAYDKDGKLVSRESTDANGDKTKLNYDANGRITEIDRANKTGFTSTTKFEYDENGKPKSIDYTDNANNKDHIATADGGMKGQRAGHDVNVPGNPAYANEVTNIKIDPTTGQYSFDEAGARLTSQPNGELAVSQIAPGEQRRLIAEQYAADQQKAVQDSPWYKQLYDNVYNGIAGAFGEVDTSGATTTEQRTMDPKALAAINELPPKQWAAVMADMQVHNPEMYNAYKDMGGFSQTGGQQEAPNTRDYSGVDTLRRSANPEDRELFQEWYKAMNSEKPEVAQAYDRWSEAKWQERVAGWKAQQNPTQWISDLPADKQEQYLTGADRAGMPAPEGTPRATDEVFNTWRAAQEAGNTQPPTYRGEADWTYVQDLRKNNPSEYAYWRQNAGDKVGQFDKFESDHPPEDYNKVLSQLSKTDQDALIKGMYENAQKTGDYRLVNDFQLWSEGKNDQRQPLAASAHLKDFAFTENMSKEGYAAYQTYLATKNDGEASAYYGWVGRELQKGGTKLNGGEGYDPTTGHVIRENVPTGETSQLGQNAKDNPVLKQLVYGPNGEPDLEKAKQLLDHTQHALNTDTTPSRLIPRDAKISAVKDESGKDALKVEAGNKTQTWVSTGKPGEFQLAPASPDGQSPKMRVNTETQPPQVQNYVFKKQESNGTSEITTDRFGNPVHIAAADGSSLNLTWEKPSGKDRPVLAGVQRTGADGKPVDLIQRTDTGYVQVAKVNADGSVTQLTKEQQVQLAAVQVGRLNTAGGAAFGDITVVQKPAGTPTGGTDAQNGANTGETRNGGGKPGTGAVTDAQHGQTQTQTVPEKLTATTLSTNGQVRTIEAAVPTTDASGKRIDIPANADRTVAQVVARAVQETGRDRDPAAVIGAGMLASPESRRGGQTDAQGQTGDQTGTRRGGGTGTLDAPAGTVPGAQTGANGEKPPTERQQTRAERQADTIAGLQQTALEKSRTATDPAERAAWQQVAERAGAQLQQLGQQHPEVAARTTSPNGTTGDTTPRVNNGSGTGTTGDATVRNGGTTPGNGVGTGAGETVLQKQGQGAGQGGNNAVQGDAAVTRPGAGTVVAPDGSVTRPEGPNGRRPMTEAERAERNAQIAEYINQRSGGLLGKTEIAGQGANNGQNPVAPAGDGKRPAGTTDQVVTPGGNAAVVTPGGGGAHPVTDGSGTTPKGAGDLTQPRNVEIPAPKTALELVQQRLATGWHPGQNAESVTAPVVAGTDTVPKKTADGKDPPKDGSVAPAGNNPGTGTGLGSGLGTVLGGGATVPEVKPVKAEVPPGQLARAEIERLVEARQTRAATLPATTDGSPAVVPVKKEGAPVVVSDPAKPATGDTTVRPTGNTTVEVKPGGDPKPAPGGDPKPAAQTTADTTLRPAGTTPDKPVVQAPTGQPDKPVVQTELQQRMEAIRQQVATQVAQNDPNAARQFLERTSQQQAQMQADIHNAVSQRVAQDAANNAGRPDARGDARGDGRGDVRTDSRPGTVETPSQVITDRLRAVNEARAATSPGDVVGQRALTDMANQLSQSRDQILRAAGPGATMDPNSGVIRTQEGRIFNGTAGGRGELDKSALALEAGVTRLTGRDGREVIVGGREITVGKDGAISQQAASQLREGTVIRDASGAQFTIGKDANVVQRDGQNFLVARDGREIAVSRDGTITRVDTSIPRSDVGGGRVTDMPGSTRGDTGVPGAPPGTGQNQGGTRGETGAGNVARDGRVIDGAQAVGRDGRPVETGTGAGRVVFDPNAKGGTATEGTVVRTSDGKVFDRNAGEVREGTAKPGQVAQNTGGGTIIITNPTGKEQKGETTERTAGGNQKEVVVNTLSGIANAGATAGGITGHGGKVDPTTGKVDPNNPALPGQPNAQGGVVLGPANLPGVQISGTGTGTGTVAHDPNAPAGQLPAGSTGHNAQGTTTGGVTVSGAPGTTAPQIDPVTGKPIVVDPNAVGGKTPTTATGTNASTTVDPNATNSVTTTTGKGQQPGQVLEGSLGPVKFAVDKNADGVSIAIGWASKNNKVDGVSINIPFGTKEQQQQQQQQLQQQQLQQQQQQTNQQAPASTTQAAPTPARMTDDQVRSLSADQIKNLTVDQIGNMTASQIRALTEKQFNEIIQNKNLTESAAAWNAFVTKAQTTGAVNVGKNPIELAPGEVKVTGDKTWTAKQNGVEIDFTPSGTGGTLDIQVELAGGKITEDLKITTDAQGNVREEIKITANGPNGTGTVIFDGTSDSNANVIRVTGDQSGTVVTADNSANAPTTTPTTTPTDTTTGTTPTTTPTDTTTGTTPTTTPTDTTTGTTPTTTPTDTTTGTIPTTTPTDTTTGTIPTTTPVDTTGGTTTTGGTIPGTTTPIDVTIPIPIPTGTGTTTPVDNGGISSSYPTQTPTNQQGPIDPGSVLGTAIDIGLQILRNEINNSYNDPITTAPVSYNPAPISYSSPEPTPTSSTSARVDTTPQPTPTTPVVQPTPDPYVATPTVPTVYPPYDPYTSQPPITTPNPTTSVGSNIDSATGVPTTDPYVGGDRGLFPQPDPVVTPDPYAGNGSATGSPSGTPGTPHDPYVNASNGDGTPVADPYGNSQQVASAGGHPSDPYSTPSTSDPVPAQQQGVAQNPNGAPASDPYAPTADPYAQQNQNQNQQQNITSDPVAQQQQQQQQQQDPQPDPYVAKPQRGPYSDQSDNMVPPPQDPYIGPTPQQTDGVGQIVNQMFGTEPQPYGDITDGRVEVTYMGADNRTDWRVEVSEAQNDYAERRLREEEDRRRREEEERKRDEEEQAKRFADTLMTALANRKEQEALEAARRQHMLEEQTRREITRRELEEQMLAQQERKPYVVLPNDTLESIALKKLKDRRLAPLIYEVNKNIIPFKLVNGKKILQMRPRLVLRMPNAMEVKRYKSRLFGRQNTKFEYDPEAAKNPMPPMRAANPGLVRAESTQVLRGVPTMVDPGTGAPAAVPVDPATQKRRENIEALLGTVNKQQKDVQQDGRIRYVCRLGDTLRSLAMRHPALKDHTLWRLVAEVNGLSAETDDKGNPIAELKRGTSIVLPSADEIAQFRAGVKGDVISGRVAGATTGGAMTGGAKTLVETAAKPGVPTGPKTGETTSGLEIVCKPCPQCERLTTMNATICPACAFPFEGQRAITETLPEGDRTVPVPKPVVAPLATVAPVVAEAPAAPEADAAVSLLLAAGMKPVPQAEKEADRGIRNVIAPISETCRIVSFGNMDDTGVGFRTRLEVRQEEFWLPVVRYEINDDASWRHTFNLGGTRKTTRIDLPSRAAKEMAEHDLTANAEKYAEAFLKGVDINDVV